MNQRISGPIPSEPASRRQFKQKLRRHEPKIEPTASAGLLTNESVHCFKTAARRLPSRANYSMEQATASSKNTPESVASNRLQLRTTTSCRPRECCMQTWGRTSHRLRQARTKAAIVRLKRRAERACRRDSSENAERNSRGKRREERHPPPATSEDDRRRPTFASSTEITRRRIQSGRHVHGFARQMVCEAKRRRYRNLAQSRSTPSSAMLGRRQVSLDRLRHPSKGDRKLPKS